MSLLQHSDLDAALAPYLAAPQWYVGVSAGIDSSVLLHLLVRWCREHPDSPPLHALHVNHQLQESASDFEAHCVTMCAQLQVPLQCLRVEVAPRSSPEAAAREARYAAFEEAVPAGAVLFLAHHLDDQVETFFLRLLRGAGVAGLSAMHAKRSLGKALVARPLLAVSREAIERYAQASSLAFLDDPSNADTSMDRNFLRAEVLPLLESRWPGYRATVARASGHLAEAARTVRQSLGPVHTVTNNMGEVGLPVASLLEPVAAERLRDWLGHRNLPPPEQRPLQEFLRQLREAKPGSASRLDTGAYQLQRYRDAVYLLPQRLPACEQRPSCELAGNEMCDIPGVGRVSLRPALAAGFYLAAGEKARVVFRTGGEEISLAGTAQGGNRRVSLKKLLHNEGVPPWWRERVPLLMVGPELVAVGDIAPCQSSRWRAQKEGAEALWCVHWVRDENPVQSAVED